MKEGKDKNGRRFIMLTEEERKGLPDGTMVFLLDGGQAAIPPKDCKHELELTPGIPRNIKGCKHCIYWEFTME